MGRKNIITGFFSENGLLSKSFEEFEFRQSQYDMAISIYEMLENKKHILVEAPTGIGKSYAYLVPAILYAVDNKKRAVISTHTINLQEQLVNKDIPALKNLLPVDFKYALLKGKNNYLCPNRLRKALEYSNTLFETDEKIQLDKLYQWAGETIDGTLSDINFKVSRNIWSNVCAEQGICTNKTCGAPETTECYFQKAKKKAADSDLLIVNHYLFFTLFGSTSEPDKDGYLYHNDFVIFDEAHTVEQVAAEQLMPAVTREMIKYHILRLYNPKTKKGFLVTFPMLHIIPVLDNLLDLNNFFFEQIKEVVFNENDNSRNKLALRVYEKNIVVNHLKTAFADLIDNLRKLRNICKSEIQENELNDFIIKFGAIDDLIDSFLEQRETDPKIIYWVEKSSQKPDANISLCKSSIDLSDYFRENIFKDNNTCIMTSATISIKENFDYFIKRLGAENANTLALPTLFNFQNQVRIYIPRDIPTPQKESSENYKNIISDKIEYFINLNKGKALVLFTNSVLMKYVVSRLKPGLEENGIQVLVQGEGQSRMNLLETFKDNINSVLFGLDSFWLGVDVPGEALSSLIITKLPFLVPEHPLIQARLEYIDANGGNSFMDYQLPEAIFKFRQGAGRLIRNKNDKGIIAILDTRILTKSYGKHFINALEKCPVIIIENNEIRNEYFE